MTEKHRGRKDGSDERFARFAKALSSTRRLELLGALVRCPRTVESLANQTGMSMANASQHLQVLRGAGLVESEKDGLFVCYRVASAQVPEFLLALRRLAASVLGDVERILPQLIDSGMDPLEPRTPDPRVQNREVNVQPCAEHGNLEDQAREQHGADGPTKLRLMPLAELEEREVSNGPQIVACCRGPYCRLMPDVHGLRRSRELSPMRGESTVQEWRAAGYQRDRVSPSCLDSAMSRDS